METWRIPNVELEHMQYDVVVVGAGPAGSTAAAFLADANMKVLLLDKDNFPRDKPCGGGLTTRVMQRYPFVESLLDCTAFGSITHSSSFKYQLKIVRDKPLIGMVLRKDFDSALVDKAKQSGITFKENATVIDLEINKNEAILFLEDGTKISTKLVLACDGMRSILTEKANLTSTKDNKCLCVVQEQRVTKQQLETYFSDKRMVHIFIKIRGLVGYGWIFPKKEYINIGLGEFESAVKNHGQHIHLKEFYSDFIEELKQRKILPADFPIENVRGGVLPVFPIDKTYSDRLLVCGDASGFINSITGEGIYYAMVSGELAAKVAIDAVRNARFDERFLARYQRLWKREFGKDLIQLGRFNKYWGRNSETIVRYLSIDKVFAKLMVGVIGGQLRFSKYKFLIFFRFLFVKLKDKIRRHS